MSGVGLCEILISIVGGVAVLAAYAAAGAGYAAYKTAEFGAKTAVKLIKGTATVIGDAKRGRQVRLGRDSAVAQNQQQAQRYQQGVNDRDRRYEQELGKLNAQQGEMLRDFNQRLQSQRQEQAEAQREVVQAQRQYIENRCGELEQDLRVAEERFDDKLETVCRNIDERFDVERTAVQRSMAAQREAIEATIEAQRADLQGQINRLERHLEGTREAAQDWLEVLEHEVRFIRENYRHGFFFPGELEAIEERLRLGQGNVRSGIYEVSLTQEAFVQASILRRKLELAEQEWEQTRQMALESLSAGIAAYDSYRSFKLSAVQVEDGEGQDRGNTEEGYEVDAEHWTEGKWSSGRRELEKKQSLIKDSSAAVSLDDLRVCDQAGQQGLTEATALAATAKYGVVASILRADLQRDFAEKLEDSGYTVEGNAWEGDDQRKANKLVMRGPGGERMAITLTPKEDAGVLSNRLEIDFDDERCNEAERRQKLEALSSTLAQCYGIPEDYVRQQYRCKPGTDWTTNASEEAFSLTNFQKISDTDGKKIS